MKYTLNRNSHHLKERLKTYVQKKTFQTKLVLYIELVS